MKRVQIFLHYFLQFLKLQIVHFKFGNDSIKLKINSISAFFKYLDVVCTIQMKFCLVTVQTIKNSKLSTS